MAKKSLYTKRLGKIVAGDAQPLRISKYHVISGFTQNWTVVSEGSIRPVKGFSTQREAVNFAKKKASKITGMVIVHKKSGQIKDTFSYAV